MEKLFLGIAAVFRSVVVLFSRVRAEALFKAEPGCETFIVLLGDLYFV